MCQERGFMEGYAYFMMILKIMQTGVLQISAKLNYHC